jgi:hypothetical protein
MYDFRDSVLLLSVHLLAAVGSASSNTIQTEMSWLCKVLVVVETRASPCNLRNSVPVVSGFQEGVNMSCSENRKEQMITGVTETSLLVCKSQFGRIHN